MSFNNFIEDHIFSNKRLPVGDMVIDKPIVIDSPRTIEMTGIGFVYESINDYKRGIKNDFITNLIPSDDFPVFHIKSRDVHFSKGLIYTGEVEDYSSDVFYYDTNERIIRSSINNTSIDGNWKYLERQDGGGNAIGFETNIREDLMSEYGSYFDFNSMNVRYQNKFINLPKKGKYAEKLSINSMNIRDAKVWGCKKVFNFEWGSNIKGRNIQIHDFPVLTKEEFGMYLMTLNLTDSDILYEVYDSSDHPWKQAEGMHKHDTFHIEGNLKDKSNIFINEFNR